MKCYLPYIQLAITLIGYATFYFSGLVSARGKLHGRIADILAKNHPKVAASKSDEEISYWNGYLDAIKAVADYKIPGKGKDA